MWRTHSCVPRRDSSRRPRSTSSHPQGLASRKVATRHARGRTPQMKYGLIAGAGRFPILALEEARRLGHQVLTVALREEASPEVEPLAWRCHWISIGELSKLIEILKAEGIAEVIMAGQGEQARPFPVKPAYLRVGENVRSLSGKDNNRRI